MAKPRTLADTVSTGGVLADGTVSAAEVSGLASVATSGAYSDLSGRPSLPAGAVVGTTDTQTLTNKTLTAPIVTNQKLTTAREAITVSATAATGTINYDSLTQSVLFYTSNASANWTVNFRGDGSTALNSLLAVGEALTAAFLVTNGATAYFNNSVQVDGTTSGVTTRWQGGTAPAAGNASSVDVYVYTIVKTANATFSVFASQTRFA